MNTENDNISILKPELKKWRTNKNTKYNNINKLQEGQCRGVASKTITEETQTPLQVANTDQINKTFANEGSNFTGNSETMGDSLVVVTFHIEKEVFATKLKAKSTVGEIKENLANVLNLEENIIILKKDYEEIEDNFTLKDLGIQPNKKTSFQITSLNGEKGKEIIISKVRENLPTLEVITVHIAEGGDQNDLVVEIENQCCQKEWLGGYRHKITQIEYHHAESQTVGRKKEVFTYTDTGEKIPLLFNRDTQTPVQPLKDCNVDTVNNKSTQMYRTDIYIQSKTDKILTAHSYKSFVNWHTSGKVLQATITIQRAVKKWICMKKYQKIINLHNTIVNDVKKQKALIFKEQADQERQTITTAAFPNKRDDFYMLYLMVGNWWKREWQRICDLRSAEQKKAESVLLLEKEVKLLENIEKHRIVGKKEALKKERMRFLERTSRPNTFTNKRGQMISFDNTETQRAREFKEIYSALFSNQEIGGPKDRIELLITLKQLFVKQFMTYEYANDIISLVEREIDLLTIGIKLKDLRGLQKRMEQLFMHFLEQEEFNPQSTNYKKPNWPKTYHELFQCVRCHKLLPVSKFPVHVRLKAYTECKSCLWLQNIGHKRVDMSPYLKLLRKVQNSEMEKCCHGAVCFLLQPIGMGFLTNVIWHGRSAISECKDLSKLQHMRWLPDVEWAPWNTILLTDQEAKCHASIPNVFEFYDKTFIENVRQKHILGRILFLPLLKMEHEIRSNGAWASVTDSGPYIHHSHAEVFATTGQDHDEI